ncbi:hypothetical protein M440DRAFT_60373 [Trichoderma longibrachiatum ATCC 18648]|uniref:Uncharacterized protein n=1 Tax=Trichoderma longibrachiatum ATCC 18648 TaxID=983965 RepID=A0A2T4BSZ8_TRILO|nr:hypothetical protein M440DRAFT_60373 [Trichoderma longibrachiatum ATCC 18648]
MGASGLEASIWASARRRPYERFDSRSRSVPPTSLPASTLPTQPTSTAVLPSSNGTSSSSPLSPIQAFHRFEQACQRLRWKYIDLQTSYQRALSPQDYGFSPHDAEVNFKVDFHEFYVRIEQAIVFALLVFGIAVPRGTGGPRSQAAHTYHHNVLKALEDEDNPLHGALGEGNVNHALWKAKELRNRWKDAAEGRETPPLKMYDLTWIVGQILGGLELSYGIAAGRIEQLRLEGDEQAANGGVVDDGDGWEWMVEPMDWEA